ncbi:MAG: phosphoglucomutase [Thermodesulfobacteriota bacterium]
MTSSLRKQIDQLKNSDHSDNDYFELIRQAVHRRNQGDEDPEFWQGKIAAVYGRVEDEIRTRQGAPEKRISFGTSGWRGTLGKDINCYTVTIVTKAIIAMYAALAEDQALAADLGVGSLAEAQERGAVIGHDNRFGGAIFAETATNVLTAAGFTVHLAGEATTGTLSAAVLELGAAFSINLTPSHNPLEYGGFKFNGADAGPAAPSLTNQITANARALVASGPEPVAAPRPELVRSCDALDLWQKLVISGKEQHGLDFPGVLEELNARKDLVVAVDCVHGASRIHIDRLLAPLAKERLILLRTNDDPTFNGIAPEPSDANMAPVMAALQAREEPLKLGVVMDPDGDRIRFTDGEKIISMNGFGALSYHFLHEEKGKRGMVAKTVATSNLANAVAAAFGEEVFEPRVGFKEFKPVLKSALVCFEESDGITVIGHTPEKDAYIGLVLALEMILARQENIGQYFTALEGEYGHYFPAKDGVTVSKQGEELLATLKRLEKYQRGTFLKVGGEEKEISQVIDIDGLKLIFADLSWLLIRPSGTEPKVRFYVESRSEEGKNHLFAAAKEVLAEIGL